LVNESCFALLFSEATRYAHQNASDVSAIESSLQGMGESVGWRMLELLQQHQQTATKTYVAHRETR
jgi:hypothetical protein